MYPHSTCVDRLLTLFAAEFRLEDSLVVPSICLYAAGNRGLQKSPCAVDCEIRYISLKFVLFLLATLWPPHADSYSFIFNFIYESTQDGA